MPDTQSREVLKATGITRSFRDGSRNLEVLRGIDLTVKAGESVAIIGSSGCGKSTLLHLLGGLDRPDGGTIAIAGKNIVGMNERQLARWRNRHISYIFQNHHLLREFSALENVAMPLLLRGSQPPQASAKALLILQKLGLENRLQHRPGQLSGGERQRVAIAQALCGKPGCVLMDEPTGNLDEANSGAIIALIETLNRELQIAFVLVTHDLQLASAAQRTMQLSDGRLQEMPRASD